MRCREYYDPAAIENIRRGNIHRSSYSRVKKCPCAGITELNDANIRGLLYGKKGQCPDCGWEADHDMEGNLNPSLSKKFEPSLLDIVEEEHRKLRREMKIRMDQKRVREMHE